MLSSLSKQVLALALAVLPACGQLSLNGSNASSGTPSRGTSSGGTPSGSTGEPSAPSSSAHDRFAVLDVKIGMPVEGRPDFTCAKATDTHPDPNCVRFVDPRCANQPANVGQLRYGERAPQGCFIDFSSSATYLDGKLLQTSNTGDATDHRPILKPLENVLLAGTRSKPSKIYSIEYMLGLDELKEGSKLYGALTAKYGEPSYKNPPNEMRWKGDSTTVKAECDRAHCRILVADSDFERAENEQQEERNSQARQQAAPAPKL